MRNSVEETCSEAASLLDRYATNLSFHNHCVRRLRKTDSSDEFLNCRKAYEEVHVNLLDARNDYWRHVEAHNCRSRVPKRREWIQCGFKS